MRYGQYPKNHPPGTQWRTLVNRLPYNRGENVEDDSDNYPKGSTLFDELVIDRWFHLEHMGGRNYWMAIYRTDGSRLSINVRVGERGGASDISVEEDG